MPKYSYKGIEYEVDELKKNKSGDLTKLSSRILKSYQKSISKSEVCEGFLNQTCGKPIQPGHRGKCGSCYNKEYQFRYTNQFISQVTGIPDIKISSFNLF